MHLDGAAAPGTKQDNDSFRALPPLIVMTSISPTLFGAVTVILTVVPAARRAPDRIDTPDRVNVQEGRAYGPHRPT